MWQIFEGAEAQKVLRRAPKQVTRKYEFWKSIVLAEGPDALKRMKGFHDEALKGRWEGFRSSRLNIQYRVIYKIVETEVAVVVERVTPHDYR